MFNSWRVFLQTTCAVALIAALWLFYVVWGGMLAAVLADVFLGTALFIGGRVTAWIVLKACGGPA